MICTMYQSPLGPISIGSDGHVINFISFSQSNKENDRNDLTDLCMLQMDEYFKGERQTFDLPLKQSGTEFQQKVWHELTQIAFGKTISYLELSRRIGNTKAIRAAGTANGKNQLAIVVPCHRVIGSNGSLVGYAGELWRKQWLLEHENRLVNGVQKLF